MKLNSRDILQMTNEFVWGIYTFSQRNIALFIRQPISGSSYVYIRLNSQSAIECFSNSRDQVPGRERARVRAQLMQPACS